MPVSGPGEIRDVTFVFTNPLTAPISVRSATADCWCINLRRPQEPIPPGATGTVSVSARARIAEGAFVNRIYVLFDNGEYSKLEVWGEVQQFLRVTPPSLEIRNAVLNAVREASFEIAVTDNTAADVLRARIDGEEIELKEFRSERRRSTILCMAAVIPRRGERHLGSTLILETSHPRQEKVQIPLVIYPKIPVEVQPASVFLGIVKPGATVRKEFVLKWNDKEAGAVNRVRYGDHEAAFTITKTGKATILDVELRCADTPGFATGELTLELANPTSPPVIVPYSCMVRE